MISLDNFSRPFPSLGDNVLFCSNWLTKEYAGRVFQFLLSMSWQEEQIKMFGKKIIVPRRVFWMGDKNASYTYAGTRHMPVPWSELLLELKRKIENDLGLHFNSVLGNLYRNGNDYMGWHRDNESELGLNPVILSLSFGAQRRFCFKSVKNNNKYELQLTHGSALVMQGDCQQNYKHTLPKCVSVVDPRINLTFRYVIPPS